MEQEIKTGQLYAVKRPEPSFFFIFCNIIDSNRASDKAEDLYSINNVYDGEPILVLNAHSEVIFDSSVGKSRGTCTRPLFFYKNKKVVFQSNIDTTAKMFRYLELLA